MVVLLVVVKGEVGGWVWMVLYVSGREEGRRESATMWCWECGVYMCDGELMVLSASECNEMACEVFTIQHKNCLCRTQFPGYKDSDALPVMVLLD